MRHIFNITGDFHFWLNSPCWLSGPDKFKSIKESLEDASELSASSAFLNDRLTSPHRV